MSLAECEVKIRIILALIFAAGLARAEGERAGDFDYYVLALSWTPTWCALEGDDRDSPQCDADTGYGWTLHGLWPQYTEGWPSYCRTSERDPSRQETGAMANIMGSGGLAWHQWKKHGRCSGLSSEAYFTASRDAYAAVKRPEVLRQLDDPIRVKPSVIEAAFLKDNEDLSADGLTVTCKANRIQEVRICLTPDFEPRSCTGSVARDCTQSSPLLDPLR